MFGLIQSALLRQIRAGVDAGWHGDTDTPKLVIDALDNEQRRHAVRWRDRC